MPILGQSPSSPKKSKKVPTSLKTEPNNQSPLPSESSPGSSKSEGKPQLSSGKGKRKSEGKEAANGKPLAIHYPKIEVRVFSADPKKAPIGPDKKPILQPLTGEVAKQLLEWTEEGVGKFKDNYLLVDRYEKKVRCLANLHNRPYYPALAEDYALEILRRKWKFNGEAIIIDETGMVEDGQHRLIGLVLAIQEWELDKKRSKPFQKWQRFWKEEPYIEGIVVLGVSSDDETINTMNTGRKRSDSDAIYRCANLRDKPDKVRLALAKIVAQCCKLIRDRSSYSEASLAPRWPHSELFEFLERHPKVWTAAEYIYETAEGNKLAEYVPLGTATGLLYLMGSAASNYDDYIGEPNESALNWSLWTKAQDFWADIADNGKDTEALRECINNIPLEYNGGLVKGMKLGLTIKAWNLYSDGEKITQLDIELDLGRDEEGNLVLGETPRIGGIDVEREEGEVTEVGDDSEPDGDGVGGVEYDTDYALPEGNCMKGGKHEFAEEDGEKFCNKCKAPFKKS